MFVVSLIVLKKVSTSLVGTGKQGEKGTSEQKDCEIAVEEGCNENRTQRPNHTSRCN